MKLVALTLAVAVGLAFSAQAAVPVAHTSAVTSAAVHSGAVKVADDTTKTKAPAKKKKKKKKATAPKFA